MLSRRFQQLLGYPGKIRLDQSELRQWVFDMRIEAGRHEEKIRGEFVERGQDAGLEGRAKVFAVVARLERRVPDIAQPALVEGAGAGGERHLVGRAVGGR